MDTNANIVDKLDASDEQQVAFSDQEITFSVSLGADMWGTQTLILVISEGVANEAGQQECITKSKEDEWIVIFKGKFLWCSLFLY